ncbi:MAG: hypothetical protein ACM3UY_04535 [Methanocella sp.]
MRENYFWGALIVEFGVDFTHYKDSTIGRRIARRMVINQVGTLQDYVTLLRTHSEDLQALFNDQSYRRHNFFS